MNTLPTGVQVLVSKMLSGDPLSLGEVVAKIKSRDKDLTLILRLLYPKSGRAQIIGLTGLAGTVQSAIVDQLVGRYRAQQKRVAVAVIDSNFFLSGAESDREQEKFLRKKFSDDEGVYFCSLDNSCAVKEVILALDSAGFDVILVECRGSGQAELDGLKLAQTVVGICSAEDKTVPGEIIDVLAVDLVDVHDVITPTFSTIQDEKVWKVPVQKIKAFRGDGIDELLALIERHQVFLKVSGRLQLKKLEFLKNQVGDILSERLRFSLGHQFETSSGQELLEKLSRHEIDPFEAADIFSGV